MALLYVSLLRHLCACTLLIFNAGQPAPNENHAAEPAAGRIRVLVCVCVLRILHALLLDISVVSDPCQAFVLMCVRRPPVSPHPSAEAKQLLGRVIN